MNRKYDWEEIELKNKCDVDDEEPCIKTINFCLALCIIFVLTILIVSLKI